MLHKIEESAILFRNAQIENMGRALTEMAMQRRDILSEEPQKVGPAGAMKAGAESQGVSLPPEYKSAMVEADHIGLEFHPAIDLGKRLVFGRFARACCRDIGRSECLDVGFPPCF